MKINFTFLFLILFTTYSNAQRCTVCGGDGWVGSLICFSCSGSGTMQGQHKTMQNMQKAGEYIGKINISNIVDGKRAIIDENYNKALQLLGESAEAGNGEALFLYGVMHELGMGVSVNQSFAYKCYNIGSNKGNGDCIYSKKRIIESGYWEATEEMRDNFRTFLKNYIQSQNNAFYMQGGFNNSGGNNSSSAHHCNSCSGTGVCSSCNGQGRYWIDTGTYTGYNSQKLTNCAVCGGSGKCKVCYGKGTFY